MFARRERITYTSRPRKTGDHLLVKGDIQVADVAQLVEQRIRNAWVGSSNLFIGTIVYLLDRASLPLPTAATR